MSSRKLYFLRTEKFSNHTVHCVITLCLLSSCLASNLETFARRYKQEVGANSPVKVSPSTARPHSSDELFVKLNINCRDSTMETRKLSFTGASNGLGKVVRRKQFSLFESLANDKSDENIKWIKCLPNELSFQ